MQRVEEITANLQVITVQLAQLTNCRVLKERLLPMKVRIPVTRVHKDFTAPQILRLPNPAPWDTIVQAALYLALPCRVPLERSTI